MNDTLRRLSDAGTAVWLDDLSRDRLDSGELERQVREGLIVGVTTNPTIFHQAITESSAYDGQLAGLTRLGIAPADALRLLTCTDVRRAADILRPVHDATGGVDGMVSIEVSPGLAHDTAGTLAEARLLHWLVDRPNVLIKIPATDAGLPAVADCLAEGISVNVTLIFGLARYRQVMEAHLHGLERAVRAGRDVSRIASVASFFVSRVDAAVDTGLDKRDTPQARALRGQAAIANARLAYELHEQVRSGQRWQALAALGARPQRPLWASTGVKDPSYDDTRYVVELAAPDTVNTMPAATLSAVIDHAKVRGDTVRGQYEQSRRALEELGAAGIALDTITEELETDGVARFQDSWQQLTAGIRAALGTEETPDA
ncbi:transaldolase [Streptomyces sp. NBC_00243]|uniref:transaldolase n=1 Tax=Streptomyces sp. NBC_00243 TaxID=2975688 RepID=UPI002DDBF402|nr:transaldolase [Streptomyces sp. NBC_00243]WRZ25489.1 transaldolase [Streptomyces sp. NBC_00243]